MMYSLAVLGLLISGSLAKTYFKETFGDDYESRWVVSTNKGAEAGKFGHTAGKFYVDAADKGLQTSEDARFYQISTVFDEFSNEGKDLVFQFAIKHEQKIDCGGGYLKLMPKGFDQKDFNGDTPYFIMFGPDICGSSTRKTHVIFNYKGENHLIKKEVPCETDEFSHVYTLVVKADNTYEVLIDGESKQTGSLKEDWDMLPPKEIKDPEQSKPADWVDERQIPDPEDTKPEGWDDIPKEIPDPDASKPEDWDDELDGDWEPPMIDNPEYKGEWRPKMIENPEYKGEWVHPLIANPDYFDDDNLYKYDKIGAVGLEIWQVKAGTIFDNIIVTDSLEEATEFGKATLELQKVEKEKKEKEDEERRAQEEAEAKAREEAAAAEAEDEEDDEKDEL